ncbi:MAG: hypothetical protein CME62_06265 [Halobacteriovoraceae bacterium]|nr:hypothetical protein [Halobacteriovoraceae bacterium]|tara:strand:- start:1268 stop:1579 length:312 start_codon:yes stop_codon:yes gene_type:complete
MKNVIVLLSLVLSASSFACQTYQAQILAKVSKVETDSLTYCKAYVDSTRVEMYSEHGICPLSLESVMTNGVDLPLENGHDCEVRVGDTLTGYLVDDGNRIILE